jgi:uncharacterized protein
MTILAIILFTAVFLVALAGIFLPVLPGVPLAAVAALVAAWMTGFRELTLTPLLIVGVLALLSVVLDYAAGAIGAKRYGAGRAGVWGSVLGSLVGLFFFPPFGFLLGALLGAVAAELLAGRALEEAVRAAFGVFVGTLGGIFAKLFLLIAIGIVVFPRLA